MRETTARVGRYEQGEALQYGPGGRPRQRMRGFTLLEVLVALAVVGSVTVALLGTVSAATRAGDEAVDLRRGAVLADDVLSRLKLLSRDELEVLTPEPRRFEPPFEEYRWSAQTSRMEGESDLVRLRVEVRGPGPTFRVATLVHRL